MRFFQVAARNVMVRNIFNNYGIATFAKASVREKRGADAIQARFKKHLAWEKPKCNAPVKVVTNMEVLLRCLSTRAQSSCRCMGRIPGQ